VIGYVSPKIFCSNSSITFELNWQEFSVLSHTPNPEMHIGLFINRENRLGKKLTQGNDWKLLALFFLLH
jgi:hypothetical protein